MSRPLRLFFALWPDPAVRSALLDLQRLLGDCGRAVRAENLHLTLRFVGETAVEDLPLLQQAAVAARFERFACRLDRVGFWPGAGVVWVAGEPPAALLELEKSLSGNLAARGIDPDRRGFRPHCTLFRHSRSRPAVAFEPIQWAVREFVLVSSRLASEGPAYRVIGRYPGSPAAATVI